MSGGDGDDTIDVDAVATDNKGGHSIFGGAGADVFELLTSSPTAENTDIATTSDTTRLIYSSFADFHKEGDLVDSGKIADSDVVIAVIPEKLTIKNTDEFDRIEMADGAVRGANEGLYIATSDDVTAGSSVVLSATADDYLNGIDLSAATTGNSSIDASAADNTAANLFLIGGAGKNTIKGGAGGDVITGGAKADTLIGGDGDDTITGSGGLDTMTGGAGANDFIQKNLVTSNSAVLTTITDFTLGGSDDDLGGFSITNLESLGSDFDLVTGAGASIASNTNQTVYNFAINADIGGAANTIIAYGEIGDGSTSVVETAIEVGGSKATTFGAFAANDAYLALWDDGTDAYLGVVKTTAAIIDGQTAASGKLEVTKLIVLEGIDNTEAFVTNDTLAFVA